MFRSLRRKIMASYLLLVVILIGVGVWAVFNFTRLNGNLQAITQENYRSTLAAQNMVAALERQDSSMLLLLVGDQGRAQDIFQTGQAEFMIWFGRAEDNITLREEGQIIQSIRQEYQAYVALWERLRADPDARRTYNELAMPKFLLVRGFCQELLRVNHEALVQGNSVTATSARWATWSTMGVTGAAALLAVLLAWSLSETIVRPVQRLADSVRRIGEGAVKETLPVHSSDEIGQLTEEFNRMIARLRLYEESSLGQIMAERHKAEVIVKVINDPVLVLDKEMRVLLLNPAAESAIGLREEAAMGRHFLEVTGKQELFSHLKSALDPGTGVRAGERPTVLLNVRGEDRHFTLEVIPLRDADKNPAGVVAVLNDVTSFKEAERIKTEFVSTVSHEFRTPLTSIAMGVGLLKESEAISPGSREAELLDVVVEESDRLTRLVNELLDLSRMESGRIEMQFGPVDSRELLERATVPFQPQAEEKQIRLSVSPEAEDLGLSADGDKITWVLTNLISNALRYTPEGGSINLSAKRRGEIAVVSVKDTGAGIPPEMQQRIFEKFYQVPGREGGGAGLGLAISKEIIRAHGGRIWVESRPGEGSKFLFTLSLIKG